MKKLMIVFGIVMVLTSGVIVVGLARSGGERNEKSLICPTFPAGIFLGKEQMKIREGWADVQNFKYEPKWRQKEIEKEVSQLLVDSSKKSYQVISQEDLPSDFDNKVRDIYFIPAIEKMGEEEYTRLYGAILYEEKGFKGKSQVICKYPEYIGGVFTVEHEPVRIVRPSSIKPFVLGSFLTTGKGWKVTLYEQTNLNRGFPAESREVSYTLPEYFSYQEFNLSWPPKSLNIEGDLIAILMKPTGESETFKKTEEEIDESAATKLIVISGKIIEK